MFKASQFRVWTLMVLISSSCEAIDADYFIQILNGTSGDYEGYYSLYEGTYSLKECVLECHKDEDCIILSYQPTTMACDSYSGPSNPPIDLTYASSNYLTYTYSKFIFNGHFSPNEIVNSWEEASDGCGYYGMVLGFEWNADKWTSLHTMLNADVLFIGLYREGNDWYNMYNETVDNSYIPWQDNQPDGANSNEDVAISFKSEIADLSRTGTGSTGKYICELKTKYD